MNNDYIKFHILGIIAHSKKQDDDIYELPPINTWTEEFCETLNQINYDEKVKFVIVDMEEYRNKEAMKKFEEFAYIAEVKNTYIYEALPINFVRFTDTVILKNLDYADDCAKSIDKSLPFLKKANIAIKKVIESKSEPLKKYNSDLENLFNDIIMNCLMDTKSQSNHRINLPNNNVFNELLQNANDRVNDGKMNITITDNEIVLSYNEDGFSAKDFIAICTKGNSGSREYEDKTGEKGSGFKSFYNVFEKIVIESKLEDGCIECILDDTCTYTMGFDKEDKPITIESKENNEKKHYPVPKFNLKKEVTDYKTTIRLKFIENEKISFIEKNKLESKDDFEKSKVYYFLDNIDKFEINGEIFDKKKYLEDKFYKYEAEIENIDNQNLMCNYRWAGKTVKDFNSSLKSKITILFPKENLPEETCIYCTLPVSNKTLYTPFYINCPAFALEDERNSISDNEWNDVIWGKAIESEGSAFSKIFNNFAEDNSDIAYKYFPYDYKWQCLNKISFIRTITENADIYKLMALNKMCRDIKEGCKECFVFLPEYMYEWFKEKKGLDEFSCDVPFVYYDSQFDYVDFYCKILNGIYETKNINIQLFEYRIYNFFWNKYFVERNEVIQTEFEVEFLKKLNKEEYIYSLYIYEWYLGETICDSPTHCLGLEGNSIDGHNCIVQYEEKIKKIFGSINEDYFKECFFNLRTKLYFSKDKIVNKEDGFLNDVLEKFAEKLEEIYRFNDELVDDALDKDRKELFESGKIVVKLGDGSFCLSDKVKDLFTSSIIDDAKFILKGPDWAKKYVCNLDEKLMDSEFYKEREQSFFEQENMLEKYLAPNKIRWDLIKNAINEHIKHCDEITSKERYLFKSLCSKTWIEGFPLEWDKKYLELIDIYNKHIKLYENKIELNSQIKFSFNNEKLDDISKNIKDKFNDKMDRKEKEKEFIFLGEKLSLEEILKDKVRICNEKYKNTLRYCIGTHDSYNIIIVFGEESIGKMLRDLFDCNSYINSKVYSPMDCYLPNPLFKPGYDNWNDLNFNQIPEMQYSDDKEELKNILIQRFEFKLEDKWFCFRGYGGDNFKGKRCPLCGGIMISETSSLRIRSIKAIEGIHVPILMCSSCDEAVKYTENIYFCDEDENQYSKNEELKGEDELIKLLESDQNIRICFDMFPNEKKIFLLDMTLVHRLICLKKLKERKDSNEMYSDKIINNK